jgi:peptidoglycan-associated lipoprotein
MKASIALILVAAATTACSHGQKTTPVATTMPVAPAAAPAPAPTTMNPPAAVSPNVAVSGDLAARCKLEVSTAEQAAPKFGFDQFQLLPEDRNVLERIADCLTKGPLAGHAVKLTGRADPRGTEEYNLGLGSRRAGTVAQYLEHMGVSHQKVASATRGAEDATGNDESQWKLDRRVDLELND